MHLPVPPYALPYHLGQLLEDIRPGVILDSVYRIQAQPVNMILFQPVEGVMDEEISHGPAVFTIEIDGISPGRAVSAGKKGVPCIGMKVITFGAEVVVDHVQKDHETLLVGSLDENFEILRASVAAVRGKEQDSVIAPVSFTRKVGNRHELNGRDAKIYKVVQI